MRSGQVCLSPTPFVLTPEEVFSMKPRIEFTSGMVAAMAGLIAFQAGALAPLRAQAVGSCEMDMSHRGLAEQFAPELWFGPGERNFPVMPFYTAFDGVDNYGSDLIDFADLSEIAAMDLTQPAPVPPTSRRTSRRRFPPRSGLRRALTASRDASVPAARLDSLASWDSLYVKRDSTPGVGSAQAAVFYRVRTLTPLERDEMWRFLLKDPQAWHRNDMATRWPRNLRERTPFKVIEYYFYYLNDAGLEGHQEDIEFVFVFVPTVQELACRFRLVVGAAHVPRTPNNVLVSFDDNAGGRVRPSIFVELGGHASAPDANQDGASGDRLFEVGKDVNWHASNVWGTRDLQAVSGIGFSGPYRTEYTLHRGDNDVRFYPVNSGRRGGYRLLPVEPFVRLSALLDEPVPVVEFLIAALDVIEGELNRFPSMLWQPFSAPDTLSDAQVRRMQTWNRPLWTATGERLAATRHQIWEHRHYRLSPVLILKEHLYPPSFSAILNARDIASLFTYGFSIYPGEAWGGHLGFVIPTIRFPTQIPGLVQIQFGFVQNDLKRDWSGIWPGRLALSVLYDSEYSARLGWYGKVGYVRNREELFDDPALDGEITPDNGVRGPGDFTISAGLSALLWSWDRRRLDGVPGGPHSFRLRVGPRVGLKGWNDMLDGMGLEVVVSLRH